MRYNLLGRSGLAVSELCLGTMTFGGSEGMWGVIGQLRQDEADALVRAALDAGVNFFDTANVYANGASEQILGQSLRNLGVDRNEVVIATKVLGPMGQGPNAAGASRGHILDQIDPATPVEETLEALDILVRRGVVRYVGLSNWAAWQVAKALGIAAARGFAKVVSLQSYYTLVGRELEREIVPMALSEGVGLMVWSPLAGGFLSGKYRREDEQAGEGRRATFDFPPVDRDRGYAVIDVLRRIAAAKAATVAQVAIAWLLHQKAVSSVIVGAKRPEQLADNLGAADVALAAEDLAALDEVSRLAPEYPGWMIERQRTYRPLSPPR